MAQIFNLIAQSKGALLFQHRLSSISSLLRSGRNVYTAAAHLSPLADAFNLHQPNAGFPPYPGSRTGLFQIKQLSCPNGFDQLMDEAREQCGRLLDEAVSSNRNRKMVQILDDISDTLCRVADMADCVRILHPEVSYRVAASNACHAIGCLVEQLNTVPALYQASVNAATAAARQSSPRSKSIEQTMDPVDERVLDLFIADFEMSGVQLEDRNRRSDFVEAASKSLILGAEFAQAAHTPTLFQPPPDGLGSRPPAVHLNHPSLDHPNPAVRAAAYQAYYQPLPDQEQRLWDLLQARHTMAQSAGFQHFADRAVRHSLAETSERVHTFLEHICCLLSPLATDYARTHLLPLVNNQQLGASIGSSDAASAAARLHPWDVAYILGMRTYNSSMQNLPAYFSLGACMEGVSQLADCLFGLKFRIESVEPGEVWHPDVRKIGVYKGNQQHLIGLVYCDLLDRPGKPAQDCHYTIQGGRRRADGTQQLPIITLQLTLDRAPHQTSVVPPGGSHGCPPLLNFGQVENLFHEWGHALHSLLGRTRYQHVTGTRCSTDFAELPSTLFEQFALHPLVTREYARHWQTGESLKESDRLALERLAIVCRLGCSVDFIQQASYAQLDQALHHGSPEKTLYRFIQPSNVAAATVPASTHLLAEIQQAAGLSEWLKCDPPHLGAWVHRFAHLVGYGGRYYAYLMARAGALLVWRHCFANDPWSSSGGQLYMDHLLSRGGEVHPLNMLSSLLSPNSHGHDQVQLSPNQLASCLADHAAECEQAASLLVDRIDSPGLYQPRTANR